MCDQCDWKGVDSSSLIHHKKRHANNANNEASVRRERNRANLPPVSLPAIATTNSTSITQEAPPTVTTINGPLVSENKDHVRAIVSFLAPGKVTYIEKN